jgi:tetratricopeptide (TPR) repeat protein
MTMQRLLIFSGLLALSLAFSPMIQPVSAVQPVAPESRQAAVKAYNLAVDQGAAGQLEAAIQSYENALTHDPGLIQAANNLADLLGRLGRSERAISVYEGAIRNSPAGSPEVAMLHRNLGVLYENAGNTQQAATAYKTYLSLLKSPDPAITQRLTQLEPRGNAVTPDYYQAAGLAGVRRSLLWPEQMNPIPVFIAQESPEQSAYIPIVEGALRDWEAASQGRLRFQRVQSPNAARIQLLLQERPFSIMNSSAGHADYKLKEDGQGRTQSLEIIARIGTGEPGLTMPPKVRESRIRSIALHELGHAIGIWGHSPDPADIMYPQPRVPELSSRVVRTVQTLYGF